MSDFPVYGTSGKMKPLIGTAEDAYRWLTSENWIVLCDDGSGFSQFLEETVFTPGTKKNAEFEVGIFPMKVNGETKITFWFRFFDTPANRKAFAKAMEIYYQKPIPSDLEKLIKTIRKNLRKLISYDGHWLYLNEDKLLEP